MSVLTNPADGAAEGAAAYIDAVLALIGDDDPRTVLGSTATFCAEQIEGLTPDQLAERLGYADADPDRALSTFSALRSANLELLDRATSADLEREGLHVERGPESVRHMLRLYAGHDLAHRRQLQRIARSLTSGGS